MRRPHAEEILGEWGLRDVTPPSKVERERLEHDRELNPGAGRPLRRRLRNFRPEADTYLASLGGPLPYMQRLRRIEADTAAHAERLREEYERVGHDAAAWRRLAERWSFTEVNELIEQHNLWYPLEARLPMDPRSRDFVLVGGRPYRREPLDARWILDRFPPGGGRGAN